MVVREHLTGGEEHELGLGRTKKCLCGKVGRKNGFRKSDEAMKEQYKEETKLLRKGLSLHNIYRITGTSPNTLLKLKKIRSSQTVGWGVNFICMCIFVIHSYFCCSCHNSFQLKNLN